MNTGFFILSILMMALLTGAICFFIWSLDNAAFSKDPKIRKAEKLAVKAVIGLFGLMLAYMVFNTAIILLAPLFEHLNSAFDAAFSKLLNLLEKLIPCAVIGGIGWAWWKEKHPKVTTTANSVPSNEVAITLAHQRGLELQKVMLAFLFRIICATRNMTNSIPPDDANGIAISTTSGESFYMDGEVVVYQAEVQVSGEITPELEDKIQKELQEAVPKYISDYPALIDPFSKEKGYPPVEILTVQKSGKRVIIDTVIATEKTLPIITNRRQARAERKLKQKPVTPPDITIFK